MRVSKLVKTIAFVLGLSFLGGCTYYGAKECVMVGDREICKKEVISGRKSSGSDCDSLMQIRYLGDEDFGFIQQSDSLVTYKMDFSGRAFEKRVRKYTNPEETKIYSGDFTSQWNENSSKADSTKRNK